MRNFRDVVRFELRQQCGSPMFAALALLFFAVHLLTISQTAVHLSDNELIAYNSVYLIFQTELVLGVFGMLPALIFVVNAATRDYSLSTAELVYTTPVSRLGFLLGRFTGATLCTLLVGSAGMLGTVAGTFMPWLDANRVAPFSLQPYAVCFATLVVPNLVVFCSLGFCVAAITRTAVLSFATSLALIVLALVINTQAGNDAPEWLSMLDPFGGMAVQQAIRYWSLIEINTLLPITGLPANRLLWLGLAALVLAFTCWRVRLELVPASVARFKLWRVATPIAPLPAIDPRRWHSSFGARDTLAQLLSQLRMDVRAVLLSPLFWIVMVLALVSTVSEVKATVSLLMVKMPMHLVTGRLIGFFFGALLQFALIVVVFYSGLLIHREREHRLHEIVGASPYPDWVTIVSKVMALCSVILLLILASMLVCIGMQAASGYYDFEIGVYLQGLFVNTGFNFCMWAVLACVLQTLVPGKWSGMLVVFAVLVALMCLPAFGWNHVLYGFRIPYVIYSDLNGFGHSLQLVYSLVVYWGAFCVLLVVAAHLLLPRGAWPSLRVRLREAGTRLTLSIKVVAAAATIVFVAAGGWIFYNTNILNHYRTPTSALDFQADYERRYAAYRKLPEAAPVDVAMAVELYPQERRLVSRGRMTLRNQHEAPLDQIVVSIDGRLSLDTLEVEGGEPSLQDKAQGFYVFKLSRPLQPGRETQLKWALVKHNRGFENAEFNTDIVENGSFIDSVAIMPFPVYVESRELTDNKERRRRGLPPKPAGLPALGDPAYLNVLNYGFDQLMNYRVVIGTDADQIAVAPGRLEREWRHAGRRYFDYKMEIPIRPRIFIASARYQVARDNWNGIPVEVYYDAKHPWNVSAILSTAKAGLEYNTREFAPYLFSYFRVVERPGYEDHAQAFPGSVPYTETVGFLADLSGRPPVDFTTAHELAHMWWGGLAYGAYMQGRKILNEGMAQYSLLMLLKQQQNPLWVRQLLSNAHEAYWNGRKGATVPELPVIKAEDEQPSLTYGKSAHVMFALQELIGADKINLALRHYLERFGRKPPPFPMSTDLVKEVRAVAGPEYQGLITDLFEKIMLYDLQMTAVDVRPAGDQYEVTMDIAAQQFEADGVGRETPVSLDTWFQVVVFPESTQDLLAQTPLYQAFHRLRDGPQRITVRVRQKPGAAGVDPFYLMYDKTPKNNVRRLAH